MNAVFNQASGKMVEACGAILRDWRHKEHTSQFLYWGAYRDHKNAFQRKIETPMQVHMASSRDVVLGSKGWLHHDPDTGLLGKTLRFSPSSFIQFKDEKSFSSVEPL